MNNRVKILASCVICGSAVVLVPEYAALAPICLEALEAIKDITKESIEAYKEKVNMRRISNSHGLESTQTITLCFNRSLTDRERDKFFANVSVFEELYGGDYVAFEQIEMSDDSRELDIYFGEEVPVEKAAKFSILFNDYLKTFTDGLYVDEVYVS